LTTLSGLKDKGHFSYWKALYVCMYVCMSENLYPARLKRKRHSRAAVSNKQKRLQCPFPWLMCQNSSSSSSNVVVECCYVRDVTLCKYCLKISEYNK